ncbi:hypothetical protein J2Z69_001739 [Paenibacillus shirakamiensis]|uniref:Uncharacterized protein n=1 Tax=Paenibacillus shirakamiensis TaxID=1265935 RepID=A0ABS4JG66_9BACL|nr:hypothetical protein [Paenibacillus shirakamiensis]MBP2000708.1 hypothetical protein [Paenibacillus shirakamiensis]
MNTQNQDYTKIIVTVNGKRTNNDLFIDRLTYAPIARKFNKDHHVGDQNRSEANL